MQDIYYVYIATNFEIEKPVLQTSAPQPECCKTILGVPWNNYSFKIKLQEIFIVKSQMIDNSKLIKTDKSISLT